MLQKILPFAFMAVAMAFVPQFMDKYSATDGKGTPAFTARNSDGSNGIEQKSPNQTAAHYATGKRQVGIRADRQGHYIADFKASGRSISGLIDTGATYVAMNRSTARSIGIRLSSSDFKHKADTANGVTYAAFATIDRLEIGPISLPDIEVYVLEDKALSSTLIGMSFISKLSEFRVEKDQLILTQ